MFICTYYALFIHINSFMLTSVIFHLKRLTLRNLHKMGLHFNRLHFSEFRCQQDPFSIFFCTAMKQMEVAFFYIRFIEFSLYCCSVYIIIIDCYAHLFSKLPFTSRIRKFTSLFIPLTMITK